MAERDLSTLLKTLSVRRHDGVWSYEFYSNSMWDQIRSTSQAMRARLVFKEREGVTLITPASAKTPDDNRWVWLELSVYSDLQAVGFLANVAEALTEANVPCNAVAAYHHDHIFVPEERADAAIAAIEALRDQA